MLVCKCFSSGPVGAAHHPEASGGVNAGSLRTPARFNVIQPQIIFTAFQQAFSKLLHPAHAQGQNERERQRGEERKTKLKSFILQPRSVSFFITTHLHNVLQTEMHKRSGHQDLIVPVHFHLGSDSKAHSAAAHSTTCVRMTIKVQCATCLFARDKPSFL